MNNFYDDENDDIPEDDMDKEDSDERTKAFQRLKNTLEKMNELNLFMYNQFEDQNKTIVRIPDNMTLFNKDRKIGFCNIYMIKLKKLEIIIPLFVN